MLKPKTSKARTAARSTRPKTGTKPKMTQTGTSRPQGRNRERKSGKGRDMHRRIGRRFFDIGLAVPGGKAHDLLGAFIASSSNRIGPDGILTVYSKGKPVSLGTFRGNLHSRYVRVYEFGKVFMVVNEQNKNELLRMVQRRSLLKPKRKGRRRK